MKRFSELSEKELLALAISMEEEHGRIYLTYADGLRADFPGSAKVFEELALEENEHRRMLLDTFEEKFGTTIPLIRSSDVKGFIKHKPIWLATPLRLDAVREQAELIEYETRRFYENALERTSDTAIRKLLGDLAIAEREHESLAERLTETHLDKETLDSEEETAKRFFVLQYVQPGLAGLMDGSVSTLAPVFAAAFATQSTWETFLVGTAASVGAGISMGFTEAMSDDGIISGRGSPVIRGWITGLMTAIGGLGHTIPYLIPDFYWATVIAILVVLIELWVIAWIRAKYMDTKFLRAAFEIVVGGLIVFAAGILIGNA
ncbi:MAG: membrane protein [Methyloligella sp.]|nr:MAG: membrane protein [Methyloligella sp.]